MKRNLILGVGTVLALALALPAVATAQLKPGDIVVADRDADPAGLGGLPGAIFKVDPDSGALSVLATSPLFRNPSGVAIDARGRVVVADAGEAYPQGKGGEAIFRFVPGGAPEVLATSSLFEDPFGVAVDAQGGVLVADPAADPFGSGPSGDFGAIFRFVPGSAPGVLATSSLFRHPRGVAFDARGRVVVADSDSDPTAMGGSPGAIFRFRQGAAPAVLAAGSPFVDPRDVAIDARGRLVVADANANPHSTPNNGAIFRFAPGSLPSFLTTSSIFLNPEGIEIDFQGRVVVADRKKILRFAPGDPPARLSEVGLRLPTDIAIVPPRCFGSFAALPGPIGPVVTASRGPGGDEIAGKTVIGDDNGNRLIGTDGADVIIGGGGRDRIIGGKGRDLICGGPGRDVLKGGKGRDKLKGGKGADRLFGGKGPDKLKGGKGADRLFGGKGKDTLRGGKGRDQEKQ